MIMLCTMEVYRLWNHGGLSSMSVTATPRYDTSGTTCSFSFCSSFSVVVIFSVTTSSLILTYCVVFLLTVAVPPWPSSFSILLKDDGNDDSTQILPPNPEAIQYDNIIHWMNMTTRSVTIIIFEPNILVVDVNDCDIPCRDAVDDGGLLSC